MILELDGITFWLIDIYIHGTVLLAVADAALAFIKQPARRMPVAWGATVGLVALAILPAMSWWPRIATPVWLIAAPAQSQAQRGHLKTTASDGSDPASANEPASQGGIAKLLLADDMQTDPEDSPPTAIEAIAMTSPLDDGLASLNEPRGAEHANGDASHAGLSPDLAVVKADDPIIPRDLRIRATWLWLSGAFLTAIWIACGAWRTRGLVRRSQAAPGWVRDELRGIVPSHRREPTTRISRRVASALVCGALRPAILLRDPQAEPDERRGIRAALAHEYAHIAHGDLWLLVLERLLLPVFFAHPLFWLLRRWVRTDQELLADAAAAGAAPVDYAEALLEWAKSSPATHATGFSAALPLWNSPCHLKRRIEMLLDVRNPIARHASRLWRRVVLTAIMCLVAGLSLVTFGRAQSAEDGVNRPPAVERISDANGSEPRPAPAAPPEPVPAAEVGGQLSGVSPAPGAPPESVPATYIVGFEMTLMQVDDAKLAGVGTSLSILIDGACEPARKSKSKDGVVAGHMPAQCVQKLVEDIKSRDAGRIVAEPKISAVFESDPIDPSPVEYPNPVEHPIRAEAAPQAVPHAANATRHKDVSVLHSGGDCGDLLITVHAQPIDRGRHEPIRLKVSAAVEFTPPADADNSADRNLQVLSSMKRKVSYAAQLQLGDALIIAGGSNSNAQADKANGVNLIIVTPLTATPVAEPSHPAGPSGEIDALRKVVEELKQEIRELRDQSKRQPAQGADNVAWPISNDGGRTINPDLLHSLEARKAQADFEVAKEAYEYKARLHKRGYIGKSEVAAAKLDLQIAEIAKYRIGLTVKSAPAVSVDMKSESSKLEHGRDAIQEQRLNIKSLESELEAAKRIAAKDVQFSRSYSTQSAGSPSGAVDGLQFSAPLGSRNAAAQVRNAELRLKKAKEVLAAMELEISSEPKKTPPRPETDGAATRDSKAEERQITLRARFVEVPASSLKEICALSSTGAKPNKFVAEIAPGKDATLTGILDADDATMLNRLLDADKQAKVVFDSRVIVRSGHSARFLPKGETAVLTPAGKDASGSGSVSFHGAGATLTVLATVEERDLFRLQIVPEFSAIDATKTVGGIPGVDTRRVSTTVELREGQTVALLSSQLSADSNIRVLIFLMPEFARSTGSLAVPNPAVRDAPNLSHESPAIEPKPSSPKPDTQPVNTDAANPSDDAYWKNLRLEERLMSPPFVTSSSVGELPPSADEKPDAELEAILSKWTAAASQVQRLQCSFKRFVYHNRYMSESRSVGVIVVDAPDRAFYDLAPTNVYRLKSNKQKPDGTPYDLRTEPRERAWLWAGRRILHLDMRGKKYSAAPLAAGNQPPSEADLFFMGRPFLLGMPVSEMLKYFAVSVKRSDKEQVWLSFVPRRPEAPYREAILLLSRGNWRPQALKLVDPTGEIESVHVFEKIVVNSAEGDSHKTHLLDLAEMNLPGFREIMQQRNFPQPGNVAPGTDAVFLARQGRLTAEQFGLSVVPATIGEFPADVAKRFRGGLKVTAVVKGGLAETAGIRPDDILVGLHHWETCRQEDLDFAVRQIATMELGTDSANTDGVAAIVIRNGEVLKTTIKLKP